MLSLGHLHKAALEADLGICQKWGKSVGMSTHQESWSYYFPVDTDSGCDLLCLDFLDSKSFMFLHFPWRKIIVSSLCLYILFPTFILRQNVAIGQPLFFAQRFQLCGVERCAEKCQLPWWGREGQLGTPKAVASSP